MKTLLFLIVFVSFPAFTYCQKLFLDVYNKTGRPVILSQIWYAKDSTRGINGGVSGSTTELMQSGWVADGDIVRIDFIAIDDSTKDTIFKKSCKLSGLKKEHLVVNIISGELNDLPAELNPSPRLQIKSGRASALIRKGQTVAIKTTDRRRIKGTVRSFNNESITLVDKKNTERIIQRKAFLGIKSCRTSLNIGAFGFFPFCKFLRFEKAVFKIVHYVPDGNLRYKWVE